MFERGFSYRLMTKAGVTRDVTVLSYDGIDKRHKIVPVGSKSAQNIKMSDFTHHKKIRTCRAIQNNRAPKNEKSTRLYIFKVGNNSYKIGCTSDIDARLKAGRTWCANVQHKGSRCIPFHKTKHWRKYEQKLQREFANKRCANGGTEVFRFNNKEATQAVSFLKTMKFD